MSPETAYTTLSSAPSSKLASEQVQSTPLEKK